MISDDILLLPTTLAILLSYHAHLCVAHIAAYIIGGQLGGNFISAFITSVCVYLLFHNTFSLSYQKPLIEF